jgi:hypothetical protein
MAREGSWVQWGSCRADGNDVGIVGRSSNVAIEIRPPCTACRRGEWIEIPVGSVLSCRSVTFRSQPRFLEYSHPKWWADYIRCVYSMVMMANSRVKAGQRRHSVVIRARRGFALCTSCSIVPGNEQSSACEIPVMTGQSGRSQYCGRSETRSLGGSCHFASCVLTLPCSGIAARAVWGPNRPTYWSALCFLLTRSSPG